MAQVAEVEEHRKRRRGAQLVRNVLGGTLVFAGAAVATKAWLMRDIWWPGSFSFSGTTTYVPSFVDSAGKQLVLVYIGKLNCAPSNNPAVRVAVEQAKASLRQWARREGRQFVAVGVSTDWKVEESLRHLARFGPFDEVIAGRSWANSAAVKFMSQDYPGPIATPQVLLIERDYDAATPGRPTMPRAYHNEHLITRKVGVAEIANWAGAGAPVPLRVEAGMR